MTEPAEPRKKSVHHSIHQSVVEVDLKSVTPQKRHQYIDVQALTELAEHSQRSSMSEEDDDRRPTTLADQSSSLPYLQPEKAVTPPSLRTGYRRNDESQGGNNDNQSSTEDIDSLYAEPTPPRKVRAVPSREFITDEPLQQFGVTSGTLASFDKMMQSPDPTGPFLRPSDTPQPPQPSPSLGPQPDHYPDMEDLVGPPAEVARNENEVPLSSQQGNTAETGQKGRITQMMRKEIHNQKKARHNQQKARDKQQKADEKQLKADEKQQKAKKKKKKEKSDRGKKRGAESGGYSDGSTDGGHATSNGYVLPEPYYHYHGDGKETRTKTPVKWDTDTLKGPDSSTLFNIESRKQSFEFEQVGNTLDKGRIPIAGDKVPKGRSGEETRHKVYYAPDENYTTDEESPEEHTERNGHREYYAPKGKSSHEPAVTADQFSEEETVIGSPDTPSKKESLSGFSPTETPKVPTSRPTSPVAQSKKSVNLTPTPLRKPSSASFSPAANLGQGGTKTWIKDLLPHSVWLVIALALVAFCLLGSGSGGSGGSGLTSLAGGGIFLVALAVLCVWVWNKSHHTSKKKRDLSAIGGDDALAKSADSNGRGDDNHNDDEDDENEGNGPNDMRPKPDEQIDVLAKDRASEAGAVGRSNLLLEEAENRVYALFPDVPREIVQNAFDDYTTAPWTEKPKSLKDLKWAAKKVWQETRSGQEFDFEFKRLCKELQNEAKDLFAKLLSTCNGAYLSGDQFRVELMLEPPVALRITAFPGERVAARPDQVGVRDGYQYLFDKEKKMWKKGLDTIVLMRKHWADLQIANQPDMPPIEIVCFRPPADFTPREFEEHCKLQEESDKYEKKKSKFQRLCQAQVLAGDFAKGHRGKLIENLLNVTRPTDIAIDFIPHRHYQAERLNWNEWSSASTLRHVGRFTDVIEAVEIYTLKNQLRILDVGPCLPLTVHEKPNRLESGLQQTIGRFSYSNVNTEILRVGLENPDVLRQEGFNEAQQVAKTLCDPRVKLLNMFQPRQGRATSSFLLGISEKQQMNDLKETVEAEFEQRVLKGDVAVAGKLLHLMDRAYYALPRQRPGLGIWSDDECDRLESRLAT